MSDIIPVFLGADLNCYNFARAFHEAYGVESYAYGRYPMAPTKYSKLVHFTTVPDMDNEDTMLRILHDFAAQHKGKRLYLFGCTDDYAAMIIRRKAELLRLLCQFENINIAQSIAVGDGANDLPMLSLAGLGIAFHAKPKVKATAGQSISTIGLDGILYFLGLKDSWIER